MRLQGNPALLASIASLLSTTLGQDLSGSPSTVFASPCPTPKAGSGQDDLCPASDRQQYTDPLGRNYAIRCKTSITGSGQTFVRVDTLASCIEACSKAREGGFKCQAAVYEDGLRPGGRNCVIFNQILRLFDSEDSDAAIYNPEGSSTTSSASSQPTRSTTPSPSSCPLNSQGKCQSGTICCNDRLHFSMCVPNANGGTTQVYFGDVAAGTYCDLTQNQIRTDNEGDCKIDGELVCEDDGKSFLRCDQGGLIDFGSVAAGTKCMDGMIVAA